MVSGTSTPINAHNWYLTVLAEQGIVGIVLVGLAAIATVVRVAKAPAAPRGPGVRCPGHPGHARAYSSNPRRRSRLLAAPTIVIVAAVVADWRSVASPSPKQRATGARRRRPWELPDMCGIAGIATRDGLRDTDPDFVARMLQAVAHRGPDDHFMLGDSQAMIGATRLSIIDVEGGRQPLTDESGQIVASQNGEIYNYVELQADLERAGHRFATRSDTETIVHLYEEFGLVVRRPPARACTRSRSGTAATGASSWRATDSARSRSTGAWPTTGCRTAPS